MAPKAKAQRVRAPPAAGPSSSRSRRGAGPADPAWLRAAVAKLLREAFSDMSEMETNLMVRDGLTLSEVLYRDKKRWCED
eukprot:1651127-Lingulodinium_polyedra.AAC.1